MTRGIAPLILGYQAFDRDVRIAGVILNHLGGSRHEAKLRAVIEHYTDVPVLGAVHCDPRLAIVERHLGLMPSNEADGRRRAADRRRSARIDRRARSTSTALLRIAADARAAALRRRTRAPPVRRPRGEPDIRIGIAQDRAFGFYYADDLDALRAGRRRRSSASTRWTTRSCPTSTRCSSAAAFPSCYARELEANAALRARIRGAIDAGLPVYAECGGLMYLARSLTVGGQTLPDGRRDPRRRRDARAARRARLRRASSETAGVPVARGGRRRRRTVRAHEFHYSSLENLPADTALRVRRPARPRHRRRARRHRRRQRARLVRAPAQRPAATTGRRASSSSSAAATTGGGATATSSASTGARPRSGGRLTPRTRRDDTAPAHAHARRRRPRDRDRQRGLSRRPRQWSEDFARALARARGWSSRRRTGR